MGQAVPGAEDIAVNSLKKSLFRGSFHSSGTIFPRQSFSGRTQVANDLKFPSPRVPVSPECGWVGVGGGGEEQH